MTIGAKKLLISGSPRLDVDKLFSTQLYTVAGGNPPTTAVTVPFAPDMLWSKTRNQSTVAGNHRVIDRVRGNYSINPTSTAAQEVNTNYGSLTSSGAIVGRNGASDYNDVGWFFRRSKRFFDIVTYNGDGVGARRITHNLGVKPGLIVVKRLDSTSVWVVWHSSLAGENTLRLNSGTSSVQDSAIQGVDNFAFATSPSNGSTLTNVSGATYIAYLFAHDSGPTGIIQCGAYAGNGSATGPLVNLGWEPQWLLVKRTDNGATPSWLILDNKRSTSITRIDGLFPNDAGSERTSDPTGGAGNNSIDFVSTGFQPRSNSTIANIASASYIYMAIRKGKA